MGWIVQSDNTILHEETGVIYGPDSPVFFNIYEHEGKAVLFITSEDIPVGVDPVEFTSKTPTISAEYFDGDIMRNNVWKDKYKRKGIGSPKKMFEVISHELYLKEKKYPNPISQDKIYELLNNFKYILPGGSMLYGIGGEEFVSISNCFVIPPPYDSYGGICHTDQELVQIEKRRGGCGFDLDNIRSKGSKVKNAAVTSTGLVPFMERYSNSTNEVSQDGRRGALLLSLPLNHPDSESFITAKLDKSKINKANISVKVSDEQMLRYIDKLRPSTKPTKKLSGGLHHIIEDDWNPYSSVKPRGVTVKDSTELINLIAECQVMSAEPGLLFWDRILRESPADCYKDEGFRTSATNPCGELPLSPYSSCLLLHMNLFSYVDKPFTGEAEFDFDRLATDVIIAQRLLDDGIDVEIDNINRIINKVKNDPEPEKIKQVEIDLWEEIKDRTTRGRRTGLGTTGIADVFASLGIPYGSDESIELAIRIQKEVAFNSYKSSIIMAKERGSFPIFSHIKETNHIFIERIFEFLEDEENIISMYHRYGRRNIANLTCAPTGTVSLLAGVSSGIEPLFDICYSRRVKKNNSSKEEWDEYDVVHPGFKLWYNTVMKSKIGIDIDKMDRTQIMDLLKSSPYYGSLANDIDPTQKLKLVGGVQRFVDHSISVTHNLRKGTGVEVVKNMIADAFLTGCKGFTVYVDGSREGILNHSQDGEDTLSTFSKKDAIKRPQILDAEIHITTIASIVYCVAIGMLNGSPYEVFAFTLDKPELADRLKDETCKFQIIKVKSGRYDLSINNKDGKPVFVIGKFNKNMDADGEVICRILSTALRHGVDITFLYEQIQAANTEINNFARAISRIFKKYINSDIIVRKGTECPNCHTGQLIFGENCYVCSSCGYSRC